MIFAKIKKIDSKIFVLAGTAVGLLFLFGYAVRVANTERIQVSNAHGIHASNAQSIQDANAEGVQAAHAESTQAMAQLFASPIDFTGPYDSVQTTGLAILKQETDGVVVTVNLWHLPPGPLRLQFHKIGDCSDDKFLKAGNSFDPDKIDLSYKNGNNFLKADKKSDPPKKNNGDKEGLLSKTDIMANLSADYFGRGKAEVIVPGVNIHPKVGKPHLLDRDGSAIIIHAVSKGDDSYSRQLDGKRIACGIIRG